MTNVLYVISLWKIVMHADIHTYSHTIIAVHIYAGKHTSAILYIHTYIHTYNYNDSILYLGCVPLPATVTTRITRFLYSGIPNLTDSLSTGTPGDTPKVWYIFVHMYHLSTDGPIRYQFLICILKDEADLPM